MADVVAHERTGLLFTPGDPSALAEAVKRLLADPARLAAMRKEARHEYVTKYTGDANHAMLMDVYQKAMANCPTPGSTDRGSIPVRDDREPSPLYSGERAG
jgi:glycosyltransferase involved in cell wall biosynthesis